MKAIEARKITDTSFTSGTNAYLNKLYRDIESAAKKGIDGVNVTSPSENIIKSVIAQLKSDGYDVKRNNGYDQRDGESWDQLVVSW